MILFAVSNVFFVQKCHSPSYILSRFLTIRVIHESKGSWLIHNGIVTKSILSHSIHGSTNWICFRALVQPTRTDESSGKCTDKA